MLTPAEEGGFTVTVPALPGCITEGDTEADALTHAKEAIELYLEASEGLPPVAAGIIRRVSVEA